MSSDDVLDLVDQLLDNEKKDKPEKKKKSTKQEIIDSYMVPPSKAVPIYFEPINKETVPGDKCKNWSCLVWTGRKYITYEDWKARGKPYWDVTTAKIRQYDYRTKGYYEVLLTYLKAALEYLKLPPGDKITYRESLGEIDWKDGRAVESAKLGYGRPGLRSWLKQHDFTNHDLGYIIEIVEWYSYKEHGILSEIAEKENHLPKFDLIGKKEVSLDEMLETITGEEKKVKGACLTHPNYRGLRKARNGCKGCEAIYEKNKKAGIKETRSR